MRQEDDEERELRSVAMQNASSILLARRRAEQELLHAKEALEERSEELARSLSMMRATLESATDAILVTDDAGKVTGFNENYLTMWSLPREQVERADHDFLLEHIGRLVIGAAEFAARTRAIYASAPAQSFDLIELADGRVIERNSRIQRVAAHGVGRVWSFREITEQRRIEDALRDETRALELLNRTGTALASTRDLDVLLKTAIDAATQLSAAQFGVFYYRAEGGASERVVADSHSAACGHSADYLAAFRTAAWFAATLRGEGPLRGSGDADSGSGAAASSMRSMLAVPVALRSGQAMGGIFLGHAREGAFNARSERLIAGLAAQSAVAIENAQLYEAAQKDAAERHRLFQAESAARAQAERLSEIKDEFLATLSHELRTPLNAMLGWAQVLKNGARSGADLQKGLDAIERNARIQTQLIEDLLDMSRITSGKLRLDIRPLTPIKFVEAALETVRPAADAKRIRIERLLDSAAGPILGDPDRLQQVIWNLLSNAIKFTPVGGKIQIALEGHARHVEVAVTDSGVGIDPDFLPYVFDRFRQADSSTTRRVEGLGLGLAIVKNLMELHGGSVRVRSPGVGLGTTFTLQFPLSPSRPDAPGLRFELPRHAPAAGSPDAPDLSGITVLVVDDEIDARELVFAVLSEYGARVLSARSAPEALDAIESQHPDVMLSDIGMPSVDGYALLKHVRALGADRGGNLPAIALTAFARSEDQSRTANAGFAVHVAKPVEPAKLARTVAEVVGRA